MREESDGFTLVTSKSKKSFRKLKKSPNPDLISSTVCDLSEISRRKFVKDISGESEEFSRSEYFSKFISLLKADRASLDVSKIVCLGLGKVSSCRIAKTQLLFLISLKKEFGGDQIEVEVCDPAFSRQEIEILNEDLGFKVVEENLEGKFIAGERGLTLFYLPHCPKQLTNNFLWANWIPERLAKSILVGNSFKRILTHNVQRVIDKQARFIHLCSDFTVESAIENAHPAKDVFNDLALHSWPDAPDPKWQSWAEADSEPSYQQEDLEFVTSTS